MSELLNNPNLVLITAGIACIAFIIVMIGRTADRRSIKIKNNQGNVINGDVNGSVITNNTNSTPTPNQRPNRLKTISRLATIVAAVAAVITLGLLIAK